MTKEDFNDGFYVNEKTADTFTDNDNQDPFVHPYRIERRERLDIA